MRAAVWQVTPYCEGVNLSMLSHHAIEEFRTILGPANYVLVAEGRLLGAQNVLEQAKRCSKGASAATREWNTYRIPFLHYANGEPIYHLDVRDSRNLERQVYIFFKPEAVEALFKKRDWAAA